VSDGRAVSQRHGFGNCDTTLRRCTSLFATASRGSALKMRAASGDAASGTSAASTSMRGSPSGVGLVYVSPCRRYSIDLLINK
jgi:hypothetical protein